MVFKKIRKKAFNRLGCSFFKMAAPRRRMAIINANNTLDTSDRNNTSLHVHKGLASL